MQRWFRAVGLDVDGGQADELLGPDGLARCRSATRNELHICPEVMSGPREA